ncbi:MAG: hypothetical protein WKF94_06135 [Solirubrobacteraceae bacterium]
MLAFVAAGCGGDRPPTPAKADKGQPERSTATDGKAEPERRGRAERTRPEADRPDRRARPQASLGDAKDKRAIRELLVVDFVSDDVEVACRRAVTRRLMQVLYGGEAGCRKKVETEPDGERVDVSMIEVQGERASAHVRWTVAGDESGVEGTILLIDQDGAWRVDDLSSGLLRSLVSVGFANANAKALKPRISGLSSSLSLRVSRGLIDCVERELMHMPERSLRKSVSALVREEAQAKRLYARLLSSCQRTVRESLTRKQRNEIDFRVGVMRSCVKQRPGDRRRCLCTVNSLLRAYDNDASRLLAELRRRSEREAVFKRAFARCAS